MDEDSDAASGECVCSDKVLSPAEECATCLEQAKDQFGGDSSVLDSVLGLSLSTCLGSPDLVETSR